jgi:hypothetical protein
MVVAMYALGEGNEWKAQVVCVKISILEAYVVISV